jgi:hypothetical protein
MGASSVRHTHLKPLAFTKCWWVERTLCHGRYPWPRSSIPDAFRGSLINANDERTISDECLSKRAQQYAACFLTGPHGAVEYPMVAAELPFLV